MEFGWKQVLHKLSPDVFNEGHGDGFQYNSIIFPDAGKGILMMTNSDNGDSIFKELLEIAIADTFTPWRWQNYIHYNF